MRRSRLAAVQRQVLRRRRRLVCFSVVSLAANHIATIHRCFLVLPIPVNLFIRFGAKLCISLAASPGARLRTPRRIGRREGGRPGIGSIAITVGSAGEGENFRNAAKPPPSPRFVHQQQRDRRESSNRHPNPILARPFIDSGLKFVVCRPLCSD